MGARTSKSLRTLTGNSGVNSHQFSQYPRIRDVEDVEGVIGAHVRLKIGRVEHAGTPKYVGTLRAGEFSLQLMLETFGGGEYRIRAFDGRRYIQSFTVYMDPTVPPR